MAEAATATPSSRDRIWSEIVELGLEPYIEFLDENGYVVIPPETAMPEGLADRMLKACLEVAERRNGERPDFETGASHASMAPYESGFDSSVREGNANSNWVWTRPPRTKRTLRTAT